MVLSKQRVFAIKKYIRASSAVEAIELDKTTPVHEAYLCNDPSKEDEDKVTDAKAVGFATIEPFLDEDE